METITPEKLYQFKKDFSVECSPLKWFGKKGDVVRLKGNSLGYGHFYTTKDNRLIVMTKKEAFEYLEIVE